MTKENAIRWLSKKLKVARQNAEDCETEWFATKSMYHTAVAVYEMAIAALREKEERDKGCEYCRGAESIYQHTNTTKIGIHGRLGKKALIVESNPCPPYADCCMKDIPDRSAFVIRFCPECGRSTRYGGTNG